MKKVYLYSDKNGEFIGEYNAHPDPETPGAYIEPICSTDIGPPTVDTNEVAVFANGDWVTLPDWRGTRGYSPDLSEWVEIAEVGQTVESLGLLAEKPLTTEERVAQIEAAVQGHLDSTADAFGYDDIKTAVGYADEPAVLKFQNEGRALRAWRSLVWEKCYAELDKVQAGQRSIPTPAEAIAELPAFVPPEEA